ncbi:MAG: DUF2726 domain-containing protein, partial [Pararhodobacter sp.]
MERVRPPNEGLLDRYLALIPQDFATPLLIFAGVMLLLTFLKSILRGRRFRQTQASRPLSRWWSVVRFRSGPELDEDSYGRFEARAVHNASERALHREIEALLPRVFPPRARLLSQVSLDEILSTESKRDWQSIFGKRVDFLVVDAAFQPICAIEYQGEGHFGQGSDAARDARRRDWEKRRALRLGNVPLVEVPARWQRPELIALLSDVTGRRPDTGQH